MLRRFALPLALLVLVGTLREAQAHGGAYRGPRTTPPPGWPPGSMPKTPPAPPPHSDDAPAGIRMAARVTLDDWEFWYQHNNAPIEEMKRWLYALVESDSVLLDPPPSNDPGRARPDPTADVRKLIRTRVLPVLRTTATDESLTPEHRAAALIALGKATKSPADATLLAGQLDPKRKASPAEQRAAALALGLLRLEEPEDRLSTEALDGVRSTLLRVYVGQAHTEAVRGCAALALGLLADQPSAQGRVILDGLHKVLAADSAPQEVLVGGLVAISRFPPSQLDAEELDVIRHRIRPTDARFKSQPGYVGDHAALAIGRLGTERDAGLLRAALFRRRGQGRHVAGSSAIALGALASRVSGESRAKTARVLMRAASEGRTHHVRYPAILALSAVAVAELRAATPDLGLVTRISKWLVTQLADGRYAARGHVALALGQLGAAIGPMPASSVLAIAWHQGRAALHEELVSKRNGGRVRAGVAVAVGRLGENASAHALETLVQSEAEPPWVVGYAALGLGFMRLTTRPVIKALRGLVRHDRPRVVRHQAAKALVLLGRKDVGAIQLAELAKAKDERTRLELLVTIGETGVETEVEPLLAIMADRTQSHRVRAYACAALGRVCDLQQVPTLSLLTTGMNHRAATWLMARVGDLQ